MWRRTGVNAREIITRKYINSLRAHLNQPWFYTVDWNWKFKFVCNFWGVAHYATRPRLLGPAQTDWTTAYRMNGYQHTIRYVDRDNKIKFTPAATTAVTAAATEYMFGNPANSAIRILINTNISYGMCGVELRHINSYKKKRNISRCVAPSRVADFACSVFCSFFLFFRLAQKSRPASYLIFAVAENVHTWANAKITQNLNSFGEWWCFVWNSHEISVSDRNANALESFVCLIWKWNHFGVWTTRVACMKTT